MSKFHTLSLVLTIGVLFTACRKRSDPPQRSPQPSVAPTARGRTVAPVPRPRTTERVRYVPLTAARHKEFEAAMKKQNDCDPILVKGFSRKERITFYVQGHSARTLRTYMSWAYKKMHRFPESKPKPAQDVKLRALMKKSNTRENIFRFMMLMTKKQLLTVGY